MVKKAPVKPPKYSTRKRSRCFECGRPRSVLSRFGLCRIHFRSYALHGYLPGFKKASW